MQHLLTLATLSKAQIEDILATGVRLKSEINSGTRNPIFNNLVLGLLFEKQSLRTRVSFESLIAQHGGSSLYLGSDVGWQKREPACDFIPILTSYLDVLVIRAKKHESVEEATHYSKCPIINGLTDRSHPCQALADIMTIMEHVDDLQSTKIAYVGDANNVAYSLAVICDKLGVTLSIAAPPDYQFGDDVMSSFSNGMISQLDSPRKAVSGAHFVYTDVWISMGQEDETAERLHAFRDFQVNEELMKLGEPNCRLLHCLPARRGEEVAGNVIDGPRSLVIAEAENRLHAQKGLVAWLLKQ